MNSMLPFSNDVFSLGHNELLPKRSNFTNLRIPLFQKLTGNRPELFHDQGRYHIETSPLITAPAMKELTCQEG